MPRNLRVQLLACALVAVTFFAGCRTTPVREESFSRPFDAQKVARLSREAYKVAWHATYWANHDLCFAPFEPTVPEWETVRYLNSITWRVSWIARNIEKHPATPRVSSKYIHDVVAYDTILLRMRYQRTSFKPSTGCMLTLPPLNGSTVDPNGRCDVPQLVSLDCAFLKESRFVRAV
jgi:hypothetical protein